MEDLFNEIQTAIAENMPSVSLVDEDYGQLQTEEDHYPVTFPAVLINMEGVAWETITDEYQRGTFTNTIKLCLDCYDDTHYTSGVAGKASERIAMFKELHSVIRQIEPANATTLERISSRWYSLPGIIKVYESTYECIVDEEPA